MDPAGYSRSLPDYRGAALFIGVWSADEPRSIAALERIYRTFGSDARMRILGVSLAREERPTDSTFPIAYNQGSALLGTAAQGFVLVNEEGIVRLRGSLLDDPETIIGAIRAEASRREH
jgi:hypothetical protein